MISWNWRGGWPVKPAPNRHDTSRPGGMMDILWAPWRMDYILAPKPDACVLCLSEHGEDDAERLVLHRGRNAFVIMNKFPYNNGHLLVAPLRHAADLTDLSREESAEIIWLLQESMRILRRCSRPEGVNIGLNQGAAAGAGVRDHLHFHLVPRWNGDASFMTPICQVRVIPEHLAATRALLLPHFAALPDWPDA
jgi:ATP adenylyltransferase